MSADAIKRVCFVGIGNMGWPMAARLVRAGFEVAVTDAVAGRAKAFVDRGRWQGGCEPGRGDEGS